MEGDTAYFSTEQGLMTSQSAPSLDYVTAHLWVQNWNEYAPGQSNASFYNSTLPWARAYIAAATAEAAALHKARGGPRAGAGWWLRVFARGSLTVPAPPHPARRPAPGSGGVRVPPGPGLALARRAHRPARRVLRSRVRQPARQRRLRRRAGGRQLLGVRGRRAADGGARARHAAPAVRRAAGAGAHPRAGGGRPVAVGALLHRPGTRWAWWPAAARHRPLHRDWVADDRSASLSLALQGSRPETCGADTWWAPQAAWPPGTAPGRDVFTGDPPHESQARRPCAAVPAGASSCSRSRPSAAPPNQGWYSVYSNDTTVAVVAAAGAKLAAASRCAAAAVATSLGVGSGPRGAGACTVAVPQPGPAAALCP